VPGAGITDYAAVCRKYAEIVESRGGTVSPGTEVTGVIQGGR
jgi:L-2-hydroxyglutarate oxidase LhgO